MRIYLFSICLLASFISSTIGLKAFAEEDSTSAPVSSESGISDQGFSPGGQPKLGQHHEMSANGDAKVFAKASESASYRVSSEPVWETNPSTAPANTDAQLENAEPQPLQAPSAPGDSTTNPATTAETDVSISTSASEPGASVSSVEETQPESQDSDVRSPDALKAANADTQLAQDTASARSRETASSVNRLAEQFRPTANPVLEPDEGGERGFSDVVNSPVQPSSSVSKYSKTPADEADIQTAEPEDLRATSAMPPEAIAPIPQASQKQQTVARRRSRSTARNTNNAHLTKDALPETVVFPPLSSTVSSTSTTVSTQPQGKDATSATISTSDLPLPAMPSRDQGNPASSDNEPFASRPETAIDTIEHERGLEISETATSGGTTEREVVRVENLSAVSDPQETVSVSAVDLLSTDNQAPSGTTSVTSAPLRRGQPLEATSHENESVNRQRATPPPSRMEHSPLAEAAQPRTVVYPPLSSTLTAGEAEESDRTDVSASMAATVAVAELLSSTEEIESSRLAEEEAADAIALTPEDRQSEDQGEAAIADFFANNMGQPSSFDNESTRNTQKGQSKKSNPPITLGFSPSPVTVVDFAFDPSDGMTSMATVRKLAAENFNSLEKTTFPETSLSHFRSLKPQWQEQQDTDLSLFSLTLATNSSNPILKRPQQLAQNLPSTTLETLPSLEEDDFLRSEPAVDPLSPESLENELGDIQIIEPVARARPQPIGQLLLRSSLFSSSNVTGLQDFIPSSLNDEDLIFANSAYFLLTPQIAPRTRLISMIGGGRVLFSDNNELNYDFLNLGLAAQYGITPAAFGELGVVWRQLFTDRNNDRALSNFSPRFRIGRQDLLGEDFQLDSYYELEASLTDPAEQQRIENTLGLGISHDFTPKFRAGLSYRLTLADYTRLVRFDVRNLLRGTLTYSEGDAFISGFLSYLFGSSSEDAIDLEDLSVGISLGINAPLF